MSKCDPVLIVKKADTHRGKLLSMGFPERFRPPGFTWVALSLEGFVAL